MGPKSSSRRNSGAFAVRSSRQPCRRTLSSMRALLSTRWFQLDCVFALVLTAIGVSSVFTADPTVAVDYPPANVRLVLLAIGATAPLVFRRIYPYTALAVSAASISTIMAVPWNEGVTPLGTLALLYSVAVYRPTRVAVAGLVTVLGMFGFFALIHAAGFDDPAGILSTAVFCVPWAIGMAVRRQRMLREQAMQRALAAEHEVAAGRTASGVQRTAPHRPRASRRRRSLVVGRGCPGRCCAPPDARTASTRRSGADRHRRGQPDGTRRPAPNARRTPGRARRSHRSRSSRPPQGWAISSH